VGFIGGDLTTEGTESTEEITEGEKAKKLLATDGGTDEHR
jgi:hypothetical protein